MKVFNMTLRYHSLSRHILILSLNVHPHIMFDDRIALEYEEKIKKLERTVSGLESELRSKEIVIDALILKLKSQTSEARIEDAGVKRRKQPTVEEPPPGIETCVENTEMTSTSEEKKDAFSLDDKKPVKKEELKNIETQIRKTFTPKSNKMEFRINFSFRRFIEYAEVSYEFSLFNKKIVRTKNPLKQFIETNIVKIIKYVIDNINSLNLNQICSTFFMINSEINYKHKLVVFHDIVLMLNDYSKLNFIASALFNNINLLGDVFSQLIRKIMYHQFCIDSNMFRGCDVVEYLCLVNDNFKLSAPEISLWSSLSHFLVKHELFDDAKKVVLVDSIERGFCLRMVCHYIDWDYTYNTFILTQLYPKLISEKAAVHVYYMGVLMMNARRMFGNHESVEALIGVLFKILEWKDECSVAAYLILKQIHPIDAEDWMKNNEEDLKEQGYNIVYLKEFLLI